MTSAPILLYLLKANAVLLLLAAAYFGLLRRLTFFTLNRVYLLFALLFAAVYPALPVPALLPAEAVAPVALAVITAGTGPGAPVGPEAAAVDWAAAGLALYATGAGLLLARLLMQLLALGRLRRQSRPAVVAGQAMRVLCGAVSPFSFGGGIYLNPDQHPGPELAAVLRHEQAHVRQWHTLDVLLAQLALAAAWCNPAAWLLRRALLDNLEFLADAAVLATGLDRRAYQYSLLRLSHAPAGPALVSHFTFPTLKNRVIMMNTPLSSSGQLARYIVAGPLVLAVALGFSGVRAQPGPVVPAPPARVAPMASPAGRPVAPAASAMVPVPLRPAARPAAPKRAGIRPAAPAASQPSAATTAKPGARSLFQPSRTYLNGQLYTGDINQLNPATIANIRIFKGEQARQLFGAGAGNGVLVITTEANQNRADVRAFNAKAGIAAVASAAAAAAEGAPVATPTRTEQPTVVAYLMPAALAYLTQHYPGARLLGVKVVPPAAEGGPIRHEAQIVLGRRPAYLLFDGKGQFLSESFTSAAR